MNIPEARLASDTTNAKIAGDTSSVLQRSVGDAISTAITSSLKTASISISGKSGPDVMSVLQEVKRKGYQASISGSNLTVNW